MTALLAAAAVILPAAVAPLIARVNARKVARDAADYASRKALSDWPDPDARPTY
jgi:hypothetical protein